MHSTVARRHLLLATLLCASLGLYGSLRHTTASLELPGFCGDGTIGIGEQCDPPDDDQLCDNNCQRITYCGDGYWEGSEQCDPGPDPVQNIPGILLAGHTALCDYDCTFSACGDTIVNDAADEECDDGGESATCNRDCTLSHCGDGRVNGLAGEACDNGGSDPLRIFTTESADCNFNCTASVCGDTILNTLSEEECDDGNTVSGDGCDASCKKEDDSSGGTDGGGEPGPTASCGNRWVCQGWMAGWFCPEAEQCDDGNTVDGDGCSALCTWESQCGNGMTDTNETCDDGNTMSGDGCSSACTTEYCGDGIVSNGEQCDNGFNNSNSDPGGCRTDCTTARCGDGVTDPGEQCDKGPWNGTNQMYEGCSATCQNESYCGDGDIDPGEECDNNAFNNSDTAPNACRTNCQQAGCGDGVVDDGEDCDGSADCDSLCQLPDAQCEDGVDNDNDGDTDYPADDGCNTASDNEESGEEQCGNGELDTGEKCDTDGNGAFLSEKTCADYNLAIGCEMECLQQCGAISVSGYDRQ